MMTTVFGIKNCDTLKKALKWLDNQGIDYQYHDYRKDGLDAPLLRTFVAELGWEALVNKRGTTYRQLSDGQKASLDEASAIAIMLDNPAIIKRPLLVHKGSYYLGFKENQYADIFA
ncbi:ArsC family reductase [Salinivibrio proteolyticus]|uniref:ArsC family reductase n=1 Tax=Salinivibrio proteolyticus TaxID=334715 RepID=UPI000988CB81|nr:ArsC family reductase [Salinivibrio proteolyticus]OOF24905.1 ArsC family reductase [Salinivibrio proteolyticus]